MLSENTEEWRKRKNRELQEIYNEKNIIETIKNGWPYNEAPKLSNKNGTRANSCRYKTFGKTKTKMGRNKEGCRRLIRPIKLKIFGNG